MWYCVVALIWLLSVSLSGADSIDITVNSRQPNKSVSFEFPYDEIYNAGFNNIVDENSDTMKEDSFIYGYDHSRIDFKIIPFDGAVNSIDVSKSGLTSLEGINVTGPHVTIFNASFNKVAAIPESFFIDAPNLREINLSHNQLEQINSFAFAGPRNLTEIDLSYNSIGIISSNVFIYLHSLKFVSLKNNQIMMLNFIFSNQKPLDELHLENNPIADLKTINDLCMGKRVTQIHYSWDKVMWLNLLEENHFNVIVNSNFEGIKSTAEHKYELHCNERSFEQLESFRATFDTGENVLKILQCFTETISLLDLSDNVIGNIDAIRFEKYINLSVLSLRNVKLSDFYFAVLESNKQLKILDISFNDLKRVDHPSVLKGFHDLKDFRAAGNPLENVAGIIEYLNPSIKTLELSDLATALNLTLLSRFHDLWKLRLRNASLSITNFNPFNQLHDLMDLDISLNNFGDLNFAILSSTLEQLLRFRCAYCQMENASNIMQYLGLRLDTLDLSGNSIGHFDFDIMRHLIGLVSFIFSANKLREIDLKPLSGSIKELDFSGNDLIRIDNFEKSHFPLLKSLAISNNQFPCDHLKQLVREWNGTFKGDPWEQKHGKDCRLENSNRGETGNDSEVWLSAAIIFGSTIGVTTIGIISFCVVKRLSRNSSREDIQFRMNNKEQSNEEHIYDEIGPSTAVYDKLNFHPSPILLASTASCYDRINIDKSKEVIKQ